MAALVSIFCISIFYDKKSSLNDVVKIYIWGYRLTFYLLSLVKSAKLTPILTVVYSVSNQRTKFNLSQNSIIKVHQIKFQAKMVAKMRKYTIKDIGNFAIIHWSSNAFVTLILLKKKKRKKIQAMLSRWLWEINNLFRAIEVLSGQ